MNSLPYHPISNPNDPRSPASDKWSYFDDKTYSKPHAEYSHYKADTDATSPDNLYHESHHTLQYSSNTHHDKPSKDFYHSQNKNSKESHLLKPGNFLSIIRSINKSSQRTLITYTNLTKRVDRTSNPCIKFAFFLNELFSVEIKEKYFVINQFFFHLHFIKAIS